VPTLSNVCLITLGARFLTLNCLKLAVTDVISFMCSPFYRQIRCVVIAEHVLIAQSSVTLTQLQPDSGNGGWFTHSRVTHLKRMNCWATK